MPDADHDQTTQSGATLYDFANNLAKSLGRALPFILVTALTGCGNTNARSLAADVKVLFSTELADRSAESPRCKPFLT